MSYRKLIPYISDMFNHLYGYDAVGFGFSEDPEKRFLAERQAQAPTPDEDTVLYFRIDNLKVWRTNRPVKLPYAFNNLKQQYIHKPMEFKLVINILSKNLGAAFDAMDFLVANLQAERYNEYVETNGRLLGLERISDMRNLSALENAVWTERVQVEITCNYKSTIKVGTDITFVRKPADISDMPNSIEFEVETKK